MPAHDPLHIFMCAAEAYPYVKVGGLGDMVGSLSKALERLGVRVSILLPAYKVISHERHGIHPCRRVPGFNLTLGKEILAAEVFQARMPGTEIDVFFLKCGESFEREGVYDDPVTKEGFPDNMQRFIAFMKASIALLRRLAPAPDIFHLHDMHTGLIPGLLRTNHHDDSFWSRIGTLFTIHNAAYQGVYPKEALQLAGIDNRHFYPSSPFEFWGKINFMKAGIEYADFLNTVSETYALEIQSSPEYGYGLEGLLSRRSKRLVGIVNGIDYEVWNPETDPFIAAHFSEKDLSGKAVCKAELQKSFGLPQTGARAPVIGIVSRLVEQKGFDLLQEAAPAMGELNLQMVVLGIGQRKYQEMFRQMARQYPDKISVRFEFDNKLSHLIEAGCDMILMPSKYEPCGLNQLYSLRYGTVPIVRATGGLADTVSDSNPLANEGTGFTFDSFSGGEMMAAVRRALEVYALPERWLGIVARGMSEDWSWAKSARKYVDLYWKIKRSSINAEAT